MLLKQLRTASISLLMMTIITGLLYPLIVTGFAQLLFPRKANGSMIVHQGKLIGSELIGQQFHSPEYFWSRPSATIPFAYNAAASSGSNEGPLSPALQSAASQRIRNLKTMDPRNDQPIPVDLITSSASGLDPHISIAAAQYQIERVARTRGINRQQIQSLIARCTEGRTLGIFGEPRVNVLKLNIALDEFQHRSIR